MTLGKPFFDAFGAFNNTKFSIDLPLARYNVTNAVEMTKDSITAMGVENLFTIEIGNEPNFYIEQAGRPKTYGPADYAKEVKNYIDALEAGVPNLPGDRLFQLWEHWTEDGNPLWAV
jgi:hypothetical protein